MFDDDCEAFRQDVRAAIMAAKRSVDPRQNDMRRLLNWLQTSDLEKSSTDDLSDEED